MHQLAAHGTPAQRTSGRRQPSAALPTRPASFVLDIVNDGGDDATSDYGDDDDDAAIDYDDGGDDAASDYDDGGDDTAPASCLRRCRPPGRSARPRLHRWPAARRGHSGSARAGRRMNLPRVGPSVLRAGRG